MEDYIKMDNVKAIFLDMDGTILHKDNRVDLETTEVIQQLRDKGYKVFLATGRAHNEIHYLVPESFAVDGIISSNGTLGMVKDSVLFKHNKRQSIMKYSHLTVIVLFYRKIKHGQMHYLNQQRHRVM